MSRLGFHTRFHSFHHEDNLGVNDPIRETCLAEPFWCNRARAIEGSKNSVGLFTVLYAQQMGAILFPMQHPAPILPEDLHRHLFRLPAILNLASGIINNLLKRVVGGSLQVLWWVLLALESCNGLTFIFVHLSLKMYEF